MYVILIYSIGGADPTTITDDTLTVCYVYVIFNAECICMHMRYCYVHNTVCNILFNVYFM